MITLDGMKFMLVCMPIIILSLGFCIYLFVNFVDKRPILTIMICILILFTMFTIVYFLRVYGADVGWFPPIGSNEMTNLTLNAVVG